MNIGENLLGRDEGEGVIERILGSREREPSLNLPSAGPPIALISPCLAITDAIFEINPQARPFEANIDSVPYYDEYWEQMTKFAQGILREHSGVEICIVEQKIKRYESKIADCGTIVVPARQPYKPGLKLLGEEDVVTKMPEGFLPDNLYKRAIIVDPDNPEKSPGRSKYIIERSCESFAQ